MNNLQFSGRVAKALRLAGPIGVRTITVAVIIRTRDLIYSGTLEK